MKAYSGVVARLFRSCGRRVEVDHVAVAGFVVDDRVEVDERVVAGRVLVGRGRRLGLVAGADRRVAAGGRFASAAPAAMSWL